MNHVPARAPTPQRPMMLTSSCRCSKAAKAATLGQGRVHPLPVDALTQSAHRAPKVPFRAPHYRTCTGRSSHVERESSLTASCHPPIVAWRLEPAETVPPVSRCPIVPGDNKGRASRSSRGPFLAPQSPPVALHERHQRPPLSAFSIPLPDPALGRSGEIRSADPREQKRTSGSRHFAPVES